MDPRSHATPGELVQQFRWAERAAQDVAESREAIEEMDKLQAELDKHSPLGRSGLVEAKKAASAAAAQIMNGPPGATDQGLHAAAEGLAAAFSAIESGDRMPPSQAIALYRQSSTIFNRRLADWNTFKTHTLPELNRELERSGDAAIVLPKS
jgi:hypothetical protein